MCIVKSNKLLILIILKLIETERKVETQSSTQQEWKVYNYGTKHAKPLVRSSLYLRNHHNYKV